jgi:hypothetical protein
MVIVSLPVVLWPRGVRPAVITDEQRGPLFYACSRDDTTLEKGDLDGSNCSGRQAGPITGESQP